MAAPPDPISPGSAAQTWKLLTVARIKPLGEGATAAVIKADDSSVVVHRDPTEVADDDEEDCAYSSKHGGDPDEEDEDDEDDDDGDIERYVPFEDKLEFAEKLKSCS